MPIKILKLSEITIDAGTQARAEIDQDTVDDYAMGIERGDMFPPIDVFTDGAQMVLAEGFHRFHAHRKAGKDTIEAEIHPGTVHEARVFAFRMPRHGKRWTNADKRKVITLMLQGKEWGNRSDRAIADQIGVDHTTVGTVRRSLVDSTSENVADAPQGDKVVGGPSGGKRMVRSRSGTTTEVDTGRINAGRKKKDKPETKPAAPKAEEKAAPQKEEPAAQTKPSSALGDQDEIVDRLQFGLRQAEAERDDFKRAIEADDAKAALAAALQRMHHAERRQDELMAEAATSRKLSDFYEKQLARIGKAIGQPDLDKIAPAVEAMVRRNGKAAA